MLTEDYLRSKLKYRTVPGYGECLYKGGSGNIKVISDNVFSFVYHNLLPGNDGQLDGHYKIYVNINTFDYLIYKDSGYGSFTYTTESNNTNWVSGLIEREKSMIESIIADKLLGAYYYDHNATNSNGRSLISDGKHEPGGTNFNTPIIRWLDGCKTSLITDYRGYIWCDLVPNERSVKDLEAIKLLDKSCVIKHTKSVMAMLIIDEKDASVAYNDKLIIKGVEYCIPLSVEFEDGSIDTYFIHRVNIGEHMHRFNILDNSKNIIGGMATSYKGEDQNIINIIPKFLESL